jgi:hypothetical protein
MLLQNLATAEASRAQLGLAHSYSRAKVKFNVNRQDNMIIQARPRCSNYPPCTTAAAIGFYGDDVQASKRIPGGHMLTC